MIDRVSDEAVAASIAPALRTIYEGGSWARQVTAQLLGLVEYVAGRGADPTPDRVTRLTAALADLDGNPLVPSEGTIEARAAAALIAAIGRTDDDADDIRARLRPVLVTELDDELASTMVLMDAFRGRVRDA